MKKGLKAVKRRGRELRKDREGDRQPEIKVVWISLVRLTAVKRD